MFEIIQSVLAFIVCLGILVAVHEWGHFYVARRCGVHVERFSVGFGKPLWRRKDKLGTEYVIAAIPLGGYVRMLDERIDYVPDEKRHLAFNNKHVAKRMAIIFAGPFINFVFAVFALFVMYLIGLQTVKPVVGSVEPASIAADAGVLAGQQIVAVGDRETPDWEAVNLELVSFIGQDSVPVTVSDTSGFEKQLNLVTKHWSFNPDEASALDSLGLTPFSPKATQVLSVVAENSAASRAGLQVGDKILAFNGETIDNWQRFVEMIHAKPGENVEITINRGGQTQLVSATIDRLDTPDGQIGHLGVGTQFEAWPEGYVFKHQYGVIEALSRAMERTWRLMTLSIEMLGKLITGDVSVKNLSGPISIAQGAGMSAGYGLVYFLSFMALISVNLGIINLLPLPMLDGGHLMYFTIEWIRGKPVSEAVQEWGFRIGGMLLFTIMSIALFNDIARLM